MKLEKKKEYLRMDIADEYKREKVKERRRKGK